ncbi:ATP-binding protein [uncultured Shimia sp.]|uniref:sensor histidine kinase n=1 Tax=uncultured Shimia sp. TaxID=573152 RepID=UPI00263624ED|nr:ATP-binding protein [uncultured Shimia sp.]
MKRWVCQRIAILTVFAVLLAVVPGAVWRIGYGQALDQLAQRGEADLALAADRLTAQLQRYQELAVLLTSHPALTSLPNGGNQEAARALLREAADKTAALNLYYANPEGRVLASAFEADDMITTGAPHFERAMNGALGVHHFRDTATGLRHFLFASPSFAEDDRVSGVLTVSVDIDYVESNWQGDGPAVFFIDEQGLVFITNRDEMLFWERRPGDTGLVPPQGAAPPFNDYERAGHTLWRLDWGPYIPDRGMHMVQPLPVIAMRGEAVLDVAPATRIASLQAAAVAALIFAFGVFLYQAIQRRRVLAEANAVLEERVMLRTQALSDTNIQLRREITERQEAEAALKQAQADLVQAGKLSALGQMSAGISHELNQPLMAIQQFAENGEQFMARGKTEVAGENLSRISALAGRMARIIRNLRAFARNESEPMGRVDIVSVVQSSLELTQARLRGDQVTLEWQPPAAPIWVRGGEVRLGQVLVNLISNAADAMMESDHRVIRIAVSAKDRVTIQVSDTGPGIAEPEKIFDPFFSTKEVGSAEGMGLGLSISYGLVQSFGGNIRGANAPEGGAIFTVELDYWDDQRQDGEQAA